MTVIKSDINLGNLPLFNGFIAITVIGTTTPLG